MNESKADALLAVLEFVGYALVLVSLPTLLAMAYLADFAK